MPPSSSAIVHEGDGDARSVTGRRDDRRDVRSYVHEGLTVAGIEEIDRPLTFGVPDRAVAGEIEKRLRAIDPSTGGRITVGGAALVARIRPRCHRERP